MTLIDTPQRRRDLMTARPVLAATVHLDPPWRVRLDAAARRRGLPAGTTRGGHDAT